jgi:NADPH:quinone reductase-like Zn-dependent oxidoreductase
MRTLATLTTAAKDLLAHNPSLATVKLYEVPIHFAIVPSPTPEFDPEKNPSKVLIRVRSFSCNFRDQSVLFTIAAKNDPCFFPIGSDFAGEVLQVGAAVTDFTVGDRVIMNGSYFGIFLDGKRPVQGLPTNRGSVEVQSIDQSRLIKIPERMPFSVAGAFSIGAQTSYSMIRKLGVTPGSNVLVTAARSNTSLFAINALRHTGANVYALTTSGEYVDRFLRLGAKDVISVDRNVDNLLLDRRMALLARSLGGFDAIIDPFFDLYLAKVLPLLKAGGRYTTCGIWDQFQSSLGKADAVGNRRYEDALCHALVNNSQIIGNCLGSTEDLQRAVEDYEAGRLDVLIDSVFSGNQVGDFITRSFDASDRFGKVVYEYQPQTSSTVGSAN